MTDWNKLKVVELKAELKSRGLPQTGLKPALVERLTSAENEERSESEATVQDDTQKPLSSATSPDTVSASQLLSESNIDLPQNLSTQPLTTTDKSDEPVDDSIGILAADDITQPPPSQTTDAVESLQTDVHHSELPSLEPLELLEDRQKRKRRSQSPAPSATEASRKRPRSDEVDSGDAEVVTTSEDAAWVDPAQLDAESKVAARDGEGVEPGPIIVDVVKEDVVVEDVPMKEEAESSNKSYLEEPLEDSPSRPRDSRFKGLFSAPKGPAIPTALEQSKSRESQEPPDAEADRIISPAVHPATAALYIRDFMRPLNPTQLQNHLATLATPPGCDVDPDVIVDFYLDPIRTHAFICFTNISAASRVRSALHGCIWPEERTRKPLWVDFIPVDKVQEWTEKEESSKAGGRSAAKKWEVVYEIDEDRHVTPYLQEVGNITFRPQPVRQQSMPLSAGGTGSTTTFKPPTGPRAAQVMTSKSVTNTKALDELFKSTTTKPILYWLPVDKSLVDKRLDNMDHSTSKAYTRGQGGEINRYTFEDGSLLVDRGPEIFPGIRPPGGHRRGPHAVFRGGAGRGGYQGRSMPERPYDSYRAGRGRGGTDRRDFRDDRRY